MNMLHLEVTFLFFPMEEPRLLPTLKMEMVVQDVIYERVSQYGPTVVKTAVVAHPVGHAVAHSIAAVHLIAICQQSIGVWAFYGRKTTPIICRKMS